MVSRFLLLQTVLLWTAHTDLWTLAWVLPQDKFSTLDLPVTYLYTVCSVCSKELVEFICSSLVAWEWKTQGRRWISKGTLMHPHEYTAFLSITMLWDGPCLWTGNSYSLSWQRQNKQITLREKFHLYPSCFGHSSPEPRVNVWIRYWFLRACWNMWKESWCEKVVHRFQGDQRLKAGKRFFFNMTIFLWFGI